MFIKISNVREINLEVKSPVHVQVMTSYKPDSGKK
jgi:hypothetical protein